MQVVGDTLKGFYEASKMKVNLKKSHIFCSTNIERQTQQKIYEILDILQAANLDKYLGLPLL